MVLFEDKNKDMMWMIINSRFSINCIFHYWVLLEGLMTCALSKNVETIVVTDFNCFGDLLVNVLMATSLVCAIGCESGVTLSDG